jgi:hypothetical protein
MDWSKIIEDAKAKGDLEALTVDVMYMSKPAQELYVSELKQANGYGDIVRLYRRAVIIDEENQNEN